MRYCLQHLNDLSGSPLILRERMAIMAAHGPVTLVTNQTDGFLSGWTGPTVRFSYTKHPSAILRFLSLTLWYLRAGLYLFAALRPGDKLVASTLISSPLLVLCALKRGVSAEIFVNEVFFRVPFWRSIGLAALKQKSVEKVYLSRFVQETWRFSGLGQVVYPTLRKPLIDLASSRPVSDVSDSNALRFLLVCSQIDAKGYRLFIDIARHFQALGARHSFALYLSGNAERFAQDYPHGSTPSNLSVTFNNASPEIFFGHDVFLGLTNPAEWVETFGQTFAEAMVAGNIVIAPPVGAQLEYIRDGDNGFIFETYSLEGALAQISRVLEYGNTVGLKHRSRDSMLAFLQSCAPYRG